MAMVCLLTACSHAQPEDVVARVGDREILVKDLQKALLRGRNNYSSRSFEDKRTFLEMKKRILGEMIDRDLLFEESIQQGTYVREEELQREVRRFKNLYTEVSFQMMLEEVGISHDEWTQTKRRNLIVKKYLNHISSREDPITPEKMKIYYQENLEEFQVPERVRVRQIVTDSKEKAESILRRLRKGENFAKLARDLSLSPDRKKGGDLGFIQKGTFPREFEVCFSMNPGEISPIIPSLYGFHLFKVLKKAPSKSLSFKEVEARITLNLKQQARQQGREKLLGRLRANTEIQIDEVVLKRTKI